MTTIQRQPQQQPNEICDESIPNGCSSCSCTHQSYQSPESFTQSQTIEKDDDSELDSDGECPPPPPQPKSSTSTITFSQTTPASPLPPPPSSPKPETSVKQKSQEKHHERIKHQFKIAKQFHQYILLLKCHCNWNDYVIQRKQMILSKKQTLKRILLKWIAYVEELKQQREGAFVIKQFLEEKRRGGMQFGLEMLHHYSKQCNIVNRAFVAWKDYTRVLLGIRELNECHVMNIVSQSKTQSYFHSWRMQSILQRVQDDQKYFFLLKILKQWKYEAQLSSHDWDLKIEGVNKLVNDKRIDLKKKVFLYLRSYSSAKKKYRSDLFQFAERRAHRIMGLALHFWKSFHILVKRQQLIIYKIIKRRVIIQWKALTNQGKHQEHIFIQIIFNRWKYMVEEKMERRERHLLAINHFVHYLCKQVLLSWIRVTADAKGRLRTPKISLSKMSKMKNVFSSDWTLKSDQYNTSQDTFGTFQVKGRSTRRLAARQSIGCRNNLNRRGFSNISNVNPMTMLFSQSPTRRLNFSSYDDSKLSRKTIMNSFDVNSYGRDIYSIKSAEKSINHCFKSSILDRSPLTTSTQWSADDNISHRNSNSRPIEELMDEKFSNRSESRRPNVPSWILNELSQREATCTNRLNSITNTRKSSQRIPQDNEVVSPAAQPKQSRFHMNELHKSTQHKSCAKNLYPDSKEGHSIYSREHKRLGEYKCNKDFSL